MQRAEGDLVLSLLLAPPLAVMWCQPGSCLTRGFSPSNPQLMPRSHGQIQLQLHPHRFVRGAPHRPQVRRSILVDPKTNIRSIRRDGHRARAERSRRVIGISLHARRQLVVTSYGRCIVHDTLFHVAKLAISAAAPRRRGARTCPEV